eukprot:TRINITY_DN9562_c0_g1_i1.p1 TRINITY_DN9562_c0_g1~~TRINITY_DN9562_c0_g1_i1.p1  ORF type:complete len:350 (+),score=38.45 TRINITY_DN9562_c0_g1_i1:126-1052(+)
MEYVLEVLGQRNERFNAAIEYSNEIFYLLVFILERHYLKHYDGSFAENFYGLKRSIVTRDGKNGPPLQRRNKLICLFFLVFIPYIRSKFDAMFIKKFRQRYGNTSEEEMSLKEILFKRIYPWIIAIYEGSFFVYQLLYMYQYTKYFTPFLHLQGLIVERISMHDMVRQQKKTNMKLLEKEQINTILGRIIWYLSEGGRKILDYSRYILPMTIFIFKFLEWWYSEPRMVQQNAIPPPPGPPARVEGAYHIPEDPTVCAICGEERTNPASVPSGYVYCYPCIFEYVSEENRCPITYMSANVTQIRKIYEQ